MSQWWCAGLAGLLMVGAEADALTAQEVLEGAPTRIREHRMGDLTVQVLRPDGQPAAGAKVRIEQERHAFLFGCNVFRLNRAPDAEVNRRYAERFAELLNFATLPFYWAGFERAAGRPNHDGLDAMAAWCADHQIVTKGHPLVWNHPASVPGWLPADLGEVRRLSDARVTDLVTRYRGRIDCWDVVNEAADPFRFANKLSEMYRRDGLMTVVRESFRLARAANPQATLLINDYQLESRFVRVIEELVDDRGRRLYDAIGIQTHQHGGAMPVDRLWAACDRYARFGVPLHFTEATILSGGKLATGGIDFESREAQFEETNPAGEARQAEAVVRFYTTLFSHPAVEAITWWDFSDDGAWLRAPAGLIRRDGTPKPAYDELLRRIKGEWWTKATVTTDAAGRATLRVFAGEHRVTSEDGRATARVAVGRGGQAAATVRLAG